MCRGGASDAVGCWATLWGGPCTTTFVPAWVACFELILDAVRSLPHSSSSSSLYKDKDARGTGWLCVLVTAGLWPRGGAATFFGGAASMSLLACWAWAGPSLCPPGRQRAFLSVSAGAWRSAPHQKGIAMLQPGERVGDGGACSGKCARPPLFLPSRHVPGARSSIHLHLCDCCTCAATVSCRWRSGAPSQHSTVAHLFMLFMPI